MQKVISATPVREVSLTAARVAFSAAATALGLLAALHLLSAELDPRWRMVSEYALGNYGGILALMFVGMGVSCFALTVAVRAHIRTVGGKIGLTLLVAAGIGLTMAALFDVKHELHGLAAMIGIPSLTIASVLVSISLVREPAFSPGRRLLLWMANLTWISLALMLATLFIGLAQSGGQFGPGIWVGIPNRILMAAYGGWLMSVASQVKG